MVKLTTDQQSWIDRAVAMQSDLTTRHYDYLYFKIAMNLIYARDSADYDKEQVLKKMLESFKRGAYKTVGTLIGQLKNLA